MTTPPPFTNEALPCDTAPPSDETRAEAAVWIARLHDEQRSPDLDGRVQAWLAESAAHRQAFERMTRVWEGIAALRSNRPRLTIALEKRTTLKRWAFPLVASVLLGSGVAALRLWRANNVVTDIGQQQVRLLPDGTRVMLNTDTRVELRYDRHARRVRLVHGEAWFDVAKRPTWPFVVTVDNREIRALGTSFVVRHDAVQPFSVTLVEGQISVSAEAPAGAMLPGAAPDRPRTLNSGQRLAVSTDSMTLLDRPELSRLTAWERGRVEFEDTPLGDAAEEMNRYSTTRVIVDDLATAHLRLGGVFRAGDSDEFVRIASVALGLRVERRRSALVLHPAAAEP